MFLQLYLIYIYLDINFILLVLTFYIPLNRHQKIILWFTKVKCKKKINTLVYKSENNIRKFRDIDNIIQSYQTLFAVQMVIIKTVEYLNVKKPTNSINFIFYCSFVVLTFLSFDLIHVCKLLGKYDILQLIYIIRSLPKKPILKT